MQQQLSVLTLGVADPARSRRFYAEGFGWTPVFEIPGEIVFFQMNGFVLGLWRRDALAEDTNRPAASGPGAFALAHNVAAALSRPAGRSCATPRRPPTAGSGATSQIPTAMPGKSPSTRHGPSAPTAASPSGCDRRKIRTESRESAFPGIAHASPMNVRTVSRNLSTEIGFDR